MKKAKYSGELASEGVLSIVAMFDDIARNGKVLSAGIEGEFIAFLEGQEEMRRRWKELEVQAASGQEAIKALQDKNMALETKLKHARNQIEVEINKRKRVEKDRDTYEKQVVLVRELLQEKGSTTFSEKEREKLAIIHHSLPRQSSSRRTLNSGCHDDDDDEMMLTPSDVSFDKTDEDVFENIDPIYSRPRKRPSAPPFDDNDAGGGGGQNKKSDSNLNNNGYYNPYNNKENVWSTRKPDKQTKKHRRSKSADLMMTESGLSSVEGQVTPARNKRNSSPFSSPFIRNNSQDSMTPIGWPGELKRFNSGSSLTRPHFFVTTKHFKSEQCFVCHKKFKFGGNQQKCKDCKIWCHDACKDLAPLPCMAIINTPKHSKDSPSVIGDFAPLEPPFVPAIVILCINEVEARGLSEQGLYRVSGNGKEVKELKERFLSRGKSMPNLNSICDIHVVCGFFKDFLRNLKESILTHKLWSHFHTAAQKTDAVECQSELIQVVSLLPLPNRDTLAFIVLHLQKVSDVKEVQMDVNNLSMVFAPTLVGQPHPSSPEASLPFETLLNHQRRIILKLLEISSDYWFSFIKVYEPSLHSSITPSNVEAAVTKSPANREGSVTPSGNTTMINPPLYNNNNNNTNNNNKDNNDNNAYWSNKNVGWFNNVNPTTPLKEIQVGSYMRKTPRFFAPPK